jgi:hypothetical protein
MDARHQADASESAFRVDRPVAVQGGRDLDTATERRRRVFGGVDTHTDVQVAAVLR